MQIDKFGDTNLDWLAVDEPKAMSARALRILETAQRLLSSGNPYHDDKGLFSSGGGSGKNSTADESHYSSPKDAFHAIANGDKAAVGHADLRKVLEHAVKDGGVVDLTNLTVDDTALFAGGLNQKRATMPQIDKDHQEAFLKSLEEQGIKVKYESVRPTSLLPTQNEINAARVGKKLQEYDDGKRDSTPVTISKDGYILDGHHRFAAMATIEVDGLKSIKMPVMRIMVDHEKALSVMRDFMKVNHIKYAALQNVETSSD